MLSILIHRSAFPFYRLKNANKNVQKPNTVIAKPRTSLLGLEIFLSSFRSSSTKNTATIYVIKYVRIPEAQEVGEKPIITLADAPIKKIRAARIPTLGSSKLVTKPTSKHKINPKISKVGSQVLGCRNAIPVPVSAKISFNRSVEKIALK